MSKPKEIEIPVWWSNGDGMIYRRECLSITHPEHTYNYVKNQMGLIPEDYGIFHPIVEKYQNHTREELLAVISQLEQSLEAAYQHI
jgi:hypothetical protein